MKLKQKRSNVVWKEGELQKTTNEKIEGLETIVKELHQKNVNNMKQVVTSLMKICFVINKKWTS